MRFIDNFAKHLKFKTDIKAIKNNISVIDKQKEERQYGSDKIKDGKKDNSTNNKK